MKNLEYRQGKHLWKSSCKGRDCRRFASYYVLYQKYKEDYQIPEILKGTINATQYEKVCKMAQMAQFEERFTVTELILDCLDREIGIFTLEDKKSKGTT